MTTLRPNGVHHLAISTADIKQQIAFFSDVLGAKLVALYWMHGTKGAWHGFMELSPSCSIAFVQTPEVKDRAPQIGVTHAETPGHPTAAGTMQHLALNVDDSEQLLAMRDRIRSQGVPAFGPVDHGMCRSIYFAGPENLVLEVSTSASAIDPELWIDPEVVGLAGITADELERFREPKPFASGGPVPQPAFDATKPHMRYPEAVYMTMLQMPDAAISAASDFARPPVKREPAPVAQPVSRPFVLRSWSPEPRAAWARRRHSRSPDGATICCFSALRSAAQRSPARRRQRQALRWSLQAKTWPIPPRKLPLWPPSGDPRGNPPAW